MTFRATYNAQMRRIFFSHRQSSMPMAFTTNSFSLAISPLVKSPTAISPSSSWGFFNSTAFCCRNPATAISRRLILLPSVSRIWDALTGGGNSARDAVLAISRGMLLFRKVLFLRLWFLRVLVSLIERSNADDKFDLVYFLFWSASIIPLVRILLGPMFLRQATGRVISALATAISSVWHVIMVRFLLAGWHSYFFPHFRAMLMVLWRSLMRQ